MTQGQLKGMAGIAGVKLIGLVIGDRGFFQPVGRGQHITKIAPDIGKIRRGAQGVVIQGFRLVKMAGCGQDHRQIGHRPGAFRRNGQGMTGNIFGF